MLFSYRRRQRALDAQRLASHPDEAEITRLKSSLQTLEQTRARKQIEVARRNAAQEGRDDAARAATRALEAEGAAALAAEGDRRREAFEAAVTELVGGEIALRATLEDERRLELGLMLMDSSFAVTNRSVRAMDAAATRCSRDVEARAFRDRNAAAMALKAAAGVCFEEQEGRRRVDREEASDWRQLSAGLPAAVALAVKREEGRAATEAVAATEAEAAAAAEREAGAEAAAAAKELAVGALSQRITHNYEALAVGSPTIVLRRLLAHRSGGSAAARRAATVPPDDGLVIGPEILDEVDPLDVAEQRVASLMSRVCDAFREQLGEQSPPPSDQQGEVSTP